MKDDKTEMNVAEPLPSDFAQKHIIEDSLLQEGGRFNILDHIERPDEGGIYIYYKGMPYPKKGFPFPDAIWMNDMVKRISVFLIRSLGSKDMALPAFAFAILPWKMKLRTIEKMAYNYIRIGQWMMQSIFLAENRYSNPCRSLHKLIGYFSKELGLSAETARDLPRIISTMFEYDDSYRYRLEDIMSETSRTQLISQPLREFRRLASIFKQREHFGDMIGKIDGLVFIGSLCLLHPKIRKAWKKAWASLSPNDFDMMVLDDADKYHTLIRGDYDFQGKSIENRMKRLEMIHTTSKCHNAPVDIGGYCQECGSKCQTNFNPPPTVEIKK